MTLEEYQQLALRTRNTMLSHKDRLAAWALGLVTEATEVIDK